MRFISTHLTNWTARDTRWVFMKGREGSVVENTEREQLFDRLKSPRTFSVADIRKLDQYQRQEKELSPEHKALINGLAEFHLSLVNENFDGGMPSRTLFELRYSNLWKHIRRPVSQRVETMTSRQREKLQPLFAKSIESFSSADMERFMRYYQAFHLKARRTKLTKKDQDFADNVSQKFVAHAHTLLNGFKVDSSGQIKPVDPNADEKYLQKLSTRDKMFVLQAYRMFGRQYDWAPRHDGSAGTADYLQNFSKAIVTEMVGKLSDEQKRVEYLPMWEIIEDLTENEHLSFGMLDDTQKQNLTKFALQSRSVHVLSWVKQWQKSGRSSLLPEHISSLREIQQDPIGDVFGVNDKEMQKILENFAEENGVLYIDHKKSDGETELIDVLEAIKDKESRINPDKRFKAFEKERDNFLNSSDFIAVKAGLSSEGEEEVTTYGSAEIAPLEEFLRNLSAPEEGAPDTLISDWKAAQSANGVLGNFKQDLEAKMSGGFKKNDTLKSFHTLFTTFFKSPTGSDFDQKEQQINKEIAADRAKAADNDARIQEYIDLAKDFSESKKAADSALKTYNEGLENRVQNRRLNAADLAVLFDEEACQSLELEDVADFTTKIRDFRTGFGALIPQIINDVENELNRIGGLSVSDEDRLRLWFEVLDNVLGYRNLTQRISADGVLDGVFREILNDQDSDLGLSSNMLLDATISHYRESIYDGVLAGLGLRDRVTNVLDEDTEAVTSAEGKVLSDYLSRYDRLHNHVYETGSKQAAIEAGQRSYLQEKQENQVLQDVVRQNMYESVSKVDRDQFESVLQGFALPGTNIEAVTSALANNHQVYHELLRVSLEDAAFTRTNFYQIVSAVVPVEMHSQALPAIAKYFILWQTKRQNEAILDDVGNRLINGVPGVPGRQELNKLKLRAVEFEGDFEIVQSQFTHDFSFWNRRINSGENIPHTEVGDFLGRISLEMIPRMTSIARNMEAALEAEFPEYRNTFIASYINNILGAIERLRYEVKTIDLAYEGADWNRDSSNDLKRIQESFLSIKTAFSLDKGDMKSLQTRTKNSFEQLPETMKYLKDELGLLEPGGKKKAEHKFRQLQLQYQGTFDAYKSKNQTMIKYLRQDIKKMKAADFQTKHELTKPIAMKMIAEIEDSVETYDRGWSRFSDPNYFSNDFMVKYEDPEKQSEALLDFQTWPVLEKQVGDLKKVNQRNTKWIKAYQEDGMSLRTKLLRPSRWPKFGVKYTFSLLDLFYRMPKKIFEAFDRREERRRERAVAELGYTIFGNSGMGKEFQRMRWEEEDKRVKEFETRYDQENFDFWEQELYKIKGPNQKDEARALINLLIKEGYMRWDKPALWRTLERLQRPQKVKWNIPGDLNDKSLDEIMVMIGDACTHIWTQKIFRDWDGELEGNHKKQMESNYKNFDRMCNRAGSLDAYFSSAIEAWKNNDKSVDPAEYEGFMHRAFEFAKYNSVGGDKRWFYLIMGMTVKNDRGETLISHEAKDRFNKTHLKAMPFFDFFVDNACAKKDGMPVPEGTPGSHGGGWTHDDIQAWGDFMMNQVGNRFDDHAANYAAGEKFMMQYMLNSPVAKLRADRFGRAAGGSQDHDDAWIHGAGSSYQNLTQMLNRKSEGTDIISPDFAAQLPQAYDIYMKHTAEYIRQQEALIGDTPGWADWKNNKLLEMGEMIRKMFLVTNTLAGNYHGQSAQSPLTLDRKYWQYDPNMTNVNENRDKVNNGLKALMTISGESIDDSVLNYNGVLEIGDNYAERKANDRYKAVSAKVSDVLTHETLFNNVDNIQKWMDKMYP